MPQGRPTIRAAGRVDPSSTEQGTVGEQDTAVSQQWTGIAAGQERGDVPWQGEAVAPEGAILVLGRRGATVSSSPNAKRARSWTASSRGGGDLTPKMRSE